MEGGYELSPEMRAWVSPSLIEANYILSLSQLELQSVVAAELEANPALEMEDRQTCPLCGNILDGTFCSVCLVSQDQDQDPDRYEDFPETMVTGSPPAESGDDFDPMTLVAEDVSPREQILRDARTILEPEEHAIAEFLVDALDERGFLTVNLADVAASLNFSEESLESILEVIQDVAPVGVGARDLRECLLLQIRYLAASGHEAPASVEHIVDSHLAAFGQHKYGQIARDLGLTVEDVEEARDYIRSHLNPFPLQTSEAKSWRSPTTSPYVAPDVIISLKDDELMVEVIETRHVHLRMNSMYERLATEVGRKRPSMNATPKATVDGQDGAAPEGTLATDDDRTHVRRYSNRAKLFMSNVQQRRDTLLKISQCICELQESFLRGGIRELRPLTRAIVAQQVGVHESTVSRGTANKYVMLPSRRVIPFSDFFTPSLSTKDVIKELIERETRKGEPLTDRRICDLLLQQGIRIARRTVAKYRAELGILPSTMR